METPGTKSENMSSKMPESACDFRNGRMRRNEEKERRGERTRRAESRYADEGERMEDLEWNACRCRMNAGRMKEK